MRASRSRTSRDEEGKALYCCRPSQIAAEIARRRDEDPHRAILEHRRILRAATSGETPANPQREQVGLAWLALDSVGVLDTPCVSASEAEIPLLKEESHGFKETIAADRHYAPAPYHIELAVIPLVSDPRIAPGRGEMDNEEINQVAGPRFAHPTATASPSAQSRDMAMVSEVPTGAKDVPPGNQHADLGGWAPDVLAKLDTDSTITIEADIEVAKYSMASTMASFRRRVCRAFNFDDNDRSEVSQIKRGVASAVMCVYDRCADERRIDLLSAKLLPPFRRAVQESRGLTF